MNQKESSLKRQPYLPPRAEILELEPQSVLCSSAIDGNSTEAVTTGTFIFP